MSIAHRIDPATAQGHLSQRYATGTDRGAWEDGIPLDPAVALAQLCRAERQEHAKLPLPTTADVTAGLTLLAPIRDRMDHDELLLLAGARARGLTWEQIAETLGLDTRQAAEQRYRRLRERWQDFAPLQLAPGDVEVGEITVPPPGEGRANDAMSELPSPGKKLMDSAYGGGKNTDWPDFRPGWLPPGGA
jgi:hypothetical protein